MLERHALFPQTVQKPSEVCSFSEVKRFAKGCGARGHRKRVCPLHRQFRVLVLVLCDWLPTMPRTIGITWFSVTRGAASSPKQVIRRLASIWSAPSGTRLSSRERRWRVASAGARLCSGAMRRTRGGTLPNGEGRAVEPDGVAVGGVRWRVVLPPPGRNPGGVDGHWRAVPQGWRRANPGLWDSTPAGFKREGCAVA